MQMDTSVEISSAIEIHVRDVNEHKIQFIENEKYVLGPKDLQIRGQAASVMDLVREWVCIYRDVRKGVREEVG